MSFSANSGSKDNRGVDPELMNYLRMCCLWQWRLDFGKLQKLGIYSFAILFISQFC